MDKIVQTHRLCTICLNCSHSHTHSHTLTNTNIHTSIHHSLCECEHLSIMGLCWVAVGHDATDKHFGSLCILLHLLAKVLDNFRAKGRAAKTDSGRYNARGSPLSAHQLSVGQQSPNSTSSVAS